MPPSSNGDDATNRAKEARERARQALQSLARTTQVNKQAAVDARALAKTKELMFQQAAEEMSHYRLQNAQLKEELRKAMGASQVSKRSLWLQPLIVVGFALVALVFMIAVWRTPPTQAEPASIAAQSSAPEASPEPTVPYQPAPPPPAEEDSTATPELPNLLRGSHIADPVGGCMVLEVQYKLPEGVQIEQRHFFVGHARRVAPQPGQPHVRATRLTIEHDAEGAMGIVDIEVPPRFSISRLRFRFTPVSVEE